MENLKDIIHLFTEVSTISFEDIKKEYRYPCVFTFDNKKKVSFASYLPWGSFGTHYWYIHEPNCFIGKPPIVTHIMIYEDLIKKSDALDSIDCHCVEGYCNTMKNIKKL